MGGASTGKGCLRSSPMNAVIGRLKTSLRTFSLHAVDCVLEPMDVESSTIALMGIASVCSRSNMEIEEKLETWGRETKRQVERLFENEKRVSFDQTTGMIWSDGDEEGGVEEPTSQQTFFTHVQLDVKNDGKTPLHLYRLTLVEIGDGHGVEPKSTGFVLPLVMPAVVLPDTSQVVLFKAITGTAVDSSKRYTLYISHSGFRSHVFEGVLDGKKFLAREEAVQPQGEDGLFDRFSLDSASAQSLFPSFPYATWQVASMAVAVAVGLVVTLYIRRKRPSIRVMGRVVSSCLRSPSKQTAHGSGGITSAKAVSNRVASSRAAISKRGEDHIEMETLIKKPATMKPSDTVPKTTATKQLRLDIDRTAKLHPKRFESMWDEYVDKFQSELPEVKRPGSDELLKKLEAQGISCMASGTVDGVEKYVFYAKQRDCSWFFLATIDVTIATAMIVVTVRASGDAAEELVLQLGELLKRTIAQSASS
uniref:Beta-adaptin appendage C-terminal subdomain domain-containing protein n=1 Tax=Phytophthora ramorum TaxID=164328 RepID=H3HAN6_PHYRM